MDGLNYNAVCSLGLSRLPNIFPPCSISSHIFSPGLRGICHHHQFHAFVIIIINGIIKINIIMIMIITILIEITTMIIIILIQLIMMITMVIR